MRGDFGILPYAHVGSAAAVEATYHDALHVSICVSFIPPNSSAVLDYYCYFSVGKHRELTQFVQENGIPALKTFANYSQVHLLCQMYRSAPAICI